MLILDYRKNKNVHLLVIIVEGEMRKNKEKIISIVAILSILYMVITMVHAASYSVLVADDFSHGNGVGAFHVPFVEYLKASFAYSKSIYLGWQGTYFSMFIQALLSPINNFGFRQLRCVMAANALLFFIALVVIVWNALSVNMKEKLPVKLVVIAIIVFSFCGFQSYPEIFFWFSGATSYSFPLSFLLFAIVLFWKTYEKKSVLNIVGSLLFGIMAMGGSLTVSGTGCFIAVLLCLYLFLLNKKVPVCNVIITLVWIVAAGINAMAPGNFARHSVIDQSGVHPFTALYDATNMASVRWNYFFKSTNFVFLLIVILLIGFLFGERTEEDSYNRNIKIIVSIISLFTPVITAFPVALGYSGESIPDRCAFLIDAPIIMTSINLAYLLGKEVLAKVDIEQKKNLTITLILTATVVFMLDGFGISNVKVRQISRNISEKVYENHYYTCKEFINSLQNYNEGDDVRISNNDFPASIDDIYNFYLSDDPSHWVNQSVAQYFGFNSIAIYYE